MPSRSKTKRAARIARQVANATKNRKSAIGRSEAIAAALGNRGMLQGTEVGAAAAEVGASGVAASGAGQAAGGEASGGWLQGLFGKGKGAMKSPAGAAVSGILGYLLIDALFKQGMGIAGQVQQGGLQNQALDTQMAAATPEAAAERQMQPITKAQRDYAMMMLMRQLGMQGGPPMLADGEVLT